MMLYSQARNLVMDGDVFSFKGTWRLSILIRWWANREWRWLDPRTWFRLAPASHVGIAKWVWCAREQDGRLCVLESVGGGVRMVPLSELVKRYRGAGGEVCWHRTKGHIGSKASDEALKMWGWEYPDSIRQYAQVMSRVARWARRLMGKGADIHPEQVTCSEFVATAYQRAGHDWGKEPCMVQPVEVTEARFLEAGQSIIMDEEGPGDGL